MKTTQRFLKRDLERFLANIASLARQGERWAADGNREMADQCKRDESDLRAIHADIRSKKFRWAAIRADMLDTIVRDRIPARLFNATCK